MVEEKRPIAAEPASGREPRTAVEAYSGAAAGEIRLVLGPQPRIRRERYHEMRRKVDSCVASHKPGERRTQRLRLAQ